MPSNLQQYLNESLYQHPNWQFIKEPIQQYPVNPLVHLNSTVTYWTPFNSFNGLTVYIISQSNLFSYCRYYGATNRKFFWTEYRWTDPLVRWAIPKTCKGTRYYSSSGLYSFVQKAMKQLKQSGRSNSMYSLSQRLGEQCKSGSDSVFRSKRVVFGMIEYHINFFTDSKVR